MNASIPRARTIRALFSLCLVLFFAIRALAADAPAIVGVWEYKDPVAANSITFTLNPDGAGKVDDDAVTYTVAGNTIKIVTGGETVAYTFKIDGDTMTVSGGDLDKPTAFARKGATPKKGLGAKIKGLAAATDTPKTGIDDESNAAVGRWEFKTDKASLLMTLDPDGTGAFNGKPMKWTLKDGVLTTAIGDQSMQYKTSIAGDTLKLTMPGGAGDNSIAFARVKSGAGGGDRPNPLDIAGKLGGGDAQPAAGGPVGVWQSADGDQMEIRADALVYQGVTIPATLTARSLKISANGQTVECPFEVSGDAMNITIGGQALALKRVGGAAGKKDADAGNAAGTEPKALAGGPADAKTLAGTWDSPEGTVIIRADGTTRTGGQEYKYQVDDQFITLSDNKNFLKIPYKLDGDKLILGTGPTKTLTRAPGGPAGAAAGVWVVTESSLDPQFFMSITQYLTLYPDGAVGFAKTEGGATRTAVTENLERFSSFKNKAGGGGKTYGRWQADANGGVTIQWSGAFKNTTWQGRIDPKSGKLVLPHAGILTEGDTLAYEKQ
jgi:hypothetical protein